MTQEDKELLIRDLCARLPYGVKVKILKYNYTSQLRNFYENQFIDTESDDLLEFDEFKPYLFPMSSMTKEQKNEIWHKYRVIYYKGKITYQPNIQLIPYFDWLNAHHFDYRGLIDKGLAIDATNLIIY